MDDRCYPEMIRVYQRERARFSALAAQHALVHSPNVLCLAAIKVAGEITPNLQPLI